MESTNTYRGIKGTTFMLVLMAFWTGTGLLIANLITAQIWETSVLGMLSAYIVRQAVSSAAEAYIAAKGMPSSTATTTATTITTGQPVEQP